MRLILASSSPRRRQLLAQAGFVFDIIKPTGPEVLPPGASPEEAAITLAAAKAREVARGAPGALVIGADTVVVLGGELLGKPRDSADAASMLRRLAGRTHTVITGVCIAQEKREITFAERTSVRFLPLDDALINAYVATGEPLDKAGAYGIQGRGAVLVRAIRGDYTNVVGLPLPRLCAILREEYPAQYALP